MPSSGEGREASTLLGLLIDIIILTKKFLFSTPLSFIEHMTCFSAINKYLFAYEGD
jgi:hypothetical protein